MLKFYGIPIALAIYLGYLFPYYASLGTVVAILMLGLLFLTATVTTRFRFELNKKFGDILKSLALLFVLIPLAINGISYFIITDEQLKLGILMATIMPSAIVAPYFTKINGGDDELSFQVVLLSSILAPFVIPIWLGIYSTYFLKIQILPIFYYLILTITLPLLVGLLINKFKHNWVRHFQNQAGLINLVSLSVLTYVVSGSLFNKVALYVLINRELYLVILLFLLLDFGSFFILRLTRRSMPFSAEGMAMDISSSLKNVALSAGILIFYNPKAAIPSLVGLLVHSAMFNFLQLRGTRRP